MAATGAAAVVLGACGDDGADRAVGNGDAGSRGPIGTRSSTGAHNPQDIAFAQGMIPHHRQALEMARLGRGRATSGAVKGLAGRIEKARDPEIRTMTGWLKTWGADAPASTGGGVDRSGSGHSGRPGMMGEQDGAALERLTGKAFDVQFLTLMVEHHEGPWRWPGPSSTRAATAPPRPWPTTSSPPGRPRSVRLNGMLGGKG
ncbi:DUF305 domain-containing protein [Streptomyces sp. NPDC003007]